MDAIIHKKNPIQIPMNTQRSMSGSPPILIPSVVHGNGVSATGDTPRTDDTVDTVIFGSFANALFRFCCVTDADILVTISAETVTDVSTSNPVVSRRRRIGETRSVSRVIETVDGKTDSACATPLMYAIDTDKVKSVRSICSVTENDITNMSGLGVVSGVVLVVIEASGGVVVVVKASGGVVVVGSGRSIGFTALICWDTLSVTPVTRSSYVCVHTIPVNCTFAALLYVFAVVSSMITDRVSAVTVL